MSGRHTPGPWHVRTLENFGFNVVHYKGGDKFDIVRVAKCGDEADARLTATATDLLAVAQMVVEASDLSGVNGPLGEAARAAVAKATGAA